MQTKPRAKLGKKAMGRRPVYFLAVVLTVVFVAILLFLILNQLETVKNF